MKLKHLARCSAVGLTFATLLAVQESHAEVPLKGMIGCGLLGAEIVTGTEALLGVRQPWLFAVTGAVGLGGGVVGGYFLERATSPRIAMFTFIGGLGLIIPATILVADAMNGSDEREQETPIEPPAEPAADPADPAGLRELGRVLPPSPQGRKALIFRDAEGWGPRVPSVYVGNVYTLREVQQFSLRQVTEVSIPVLGGRF